MTALTAIGIGLTAGPALAGPLDGVAVPGTIIHGKPPSTGAGDPPPVVIAQINETKRTIEDTRRDYEDEKCLRVTYTIHGDDFFADTEYKLIDHCVRLPQPVEDAISDAGEILPG